MRSRLITLALFGAIALLSACTLYREHAVINNWSDATGGEGLERSFWQDVKVKNWTQLERHLAGNYVAITVDGQMDRATALERLQHVQLENYSIENVRTELSGSTFVVTYQLTLHGTVDDQPLPSAPLRMMTVWQQQKRSWVAIARSEMGSTAAPAH
jgi:hypothetical protein